MDTNCFESDLYTIRRKVFKLMGASFHVYGASDELVAFSKQKAFKLKEDIRLYTDEEMTEELLVISARSIIDFSAAYDVIDPKTSERVGTLKRKGFTSMFRDSWIFMDENDQEIGSIKEDSMLLALFRRHVAAIVPQKFHAEIGGEPVCTYRQRFNPFVQKIDVDFSLDRDNRYDKRLGLAVGVLLCAIEGRQK